MSLKECNDLMQKGTKALKTSFFSFKFSPDYVEAEPHFSSAAKGYLKIGEYLKAIEAFKKAIECENKLGDPYAQGRSNMEIAKIYFFNLKVFEQGVQYLNKAINFYLLSDKFTFSIKAYTDIANTFMEEKNFAYAETILKDAFKVCSEHLEDNMIATSFEPIFSKLLDVECGMKKWTEAIEMTQKYIDCLKKYTEKDNYRINKAYMKLGVLRIINGESYMLDDITMNMYNHNYDGTSEDASDLRNCVKAIETLNTKTFTFCVSGAFTLFENNLLKGLKEVYKKKEEEFKKNSNSESLNQLNNSVPIVVKKNDDNTTKAETNDENNINNINNTGNNIINTTNNNTNTSNNDHVFGSNKEDLL